MATKQQRIEELWWRYQYLRDNGHLKYTKKAKRCEKFLAGDQWDLEAQTLEVRGFHVSASRNGKTCIDCHKGVAHKLPEGIVPDEQLPGMDPMNAAALQ